MEQIAKVKVESRNTYVVANLLNKAKARLVIVHSSRKSTLRNAKVTWIGICTKFSTARKQRILLLESLLLSILYIYQGVDK